ncbi:GDP-L-fucose synthase [Porticoccaceae bacterium]|jgi:GDP-L-fucose synthase|nr:GDP-L-fucose synthase [Porticoccaceae bacterium]MDC1325029.1 GDP-L-fucose synthase [Ulvibacter sp.]
MYKDKKVLITGGTGFLGKAVVNRLSSHGYNNLLSIGRSVDLTCCEETFDFFEKEKPDAVIHLAATVGGIGANKENPGLFMYNNLVMGTNTIEASRLNKVEKFIMVGTVCAYPKFTPVPFKEEDIWNGYPEGTNAPYGIAKKSLMQLVQSYNKQYDFNGVNLIPVNMYGPHDNFDPAISHVIPALILKFYKAIKFDLESVEVWGTGEASREFLYVDDCAHAVKLALEKDVSPEPINIGTGGEIQIKYLAHTIAQVMGYDGSIYFNSDYPDGQPRRQLDISRAKERLYYEPKVDLLDGLEATVHWFMANKEQFDVYLNRI